MDVLAGVGLVLAFIALFHAIGLHRERALYPLLLMVIGLAYVLLAASDDAFGLALVEAVVALGFVGAAIAGYRRNLWWVVVALIAHAAFDAAHSAFWPSPAIPHWYAGFCIGADGLLALHLVLLLVVGPLSARPAPATLPPSDRSDPAADQR